MRYYAVFYRKTPTGQFDNYTYTKPLGDRSIIRIDGRLRFFKAMTIARETCRERHFDAFSLQRAENLWSVNLDDNPPINLYGAK